MKTQISIHDGAMMFVPSPLKVKPNVPVENGQACRRLNVLSDRELVHQYAEGNELCLAELLERHKRRIFSHIMKLVRNKALAEDIFQETFFKVIRSLKSGLYKEDDK